MEDVIRNYFGYELLHYSWISLLSVFIVFFIYRNSKRKQKKSSSFFAAAILVFSLISIGSFFVLSNNHRFKIRLIKNEYLEGGLGWGALNKGLFGHSSIKGYQPYFCYFTDRETSPDLFKDTAFIKNFSIKCFDEYPELRSTICMGYSKKNLASLSVVNYCAMKYFNIPIEELVSQEHGMRSLLSLCFAANLKSYTVDPLPAEIKNIVFSDSNQFLNGLVSANEIKKILSLACENPDSLNREDHELLITNLLYFPGYVNKEKTDLAFKSWIKRFPFFTTHLTNLNNERIRLREYIEKNPGAVQTANTFNIDSTYNLAINKILNSTGYNYLFCKKYLRLDFKKQTGEVLSYKTSVFRQEARTKTVTVHSTSYRGMPSRTTGTKTVTYYVPVFDHYENHNSAYDSLQVCMLSSKDTVFYFAGVNGIYPTFMNENEQKQLSEFNSAVFPLSWVFAIPKAYLSEMER